MKPMTIRQRISLLLMPLAFVMVLQSVDRVSYLNQTSGEFAALSAGVEAKLSDIDTLYQSAGRLEEIAAKIRVAADEPTLRALETEFRGLLENTATVAVSAVNASPELSATSISLASLESTIQQQFEERRARLALDLRWSRQILAMGADAKRLRSLVLPFDVDFLTALHRQTSDRATLEQRFQLRMALGTLLDRTDDLTAASDAGYSTVGLSEMTAIIDDTIRILSRLPQLKERSDLAGVLSTMLARLYGDNGLLAIAERLRRSDALASERDSAISAELYKAGADLSQLARETERRIADVYAATARDAEDEALKEIFVNGVLGLGIVLVVWTVFAKRISQRLELLNSEVLRIARGDLRPVRRSFGKDELGRMAEALDVFRCNARELRRSNDELANFAYVAAHDLRTPLRAIRDLVEWTIEDHGSALPSGARDNLGLIRVRADRLSRLLNDLLNYARASADSLARRPVDLNTMVGDVAEMMGGATDLRISFQGERFLMLAETPLRTILLNLFSNALKHNDHTPVEIQVCCRLEDSIAEIRVMDDGPGIPPAYQAQVFDLFRTLESRDEVEGSGLGLALVNKLVGQLEGRIELVSDPSEERGTTFILRIPASGIPAETDLESRQEGVAA